MARPGFVAICAIGVVLGLLLVPLFRPSLGIYVSFAALGMAVALQKYIASFAGYYVLHFCKLFAVGDRIRIGTIKGDVRHIGFLHFVLDEVGEGDKFGGELTGRILHIPNHIVLDQPVLNFSQNFSTTGGLVSCEYMFDEVSFPLPDSINIEVARGILERILREEDGHFVEEARRTYGNETPSFLEEASHSPRVMVFMDAQKVWLVGKYVAPVHGRNELKSRITLRFLEEAPVQANPSDWGGSNGGRAPASQRQPI